MKKIVQLKDCEYEELTYKATLNDNEIKKLAQKLYEKNGVLKVSVDFEISNRCSDRFVLQTFTREEEDYFSKTLLSIEDRRNIISIVKRTSERLISRNIEKHLKGMNSLEECENVMQKERLRFVVITLTGWLVALFMMIAICVL